MRGGNFMKGMQGFMALHQRTVEADFAAASRREAERMRIEIASAQASGVLGNGRLANLHDARSSSLLNPNGLFLGAQIGRASCRESVCQYGVDIGGGRSIKK